MKLYEECFTAAAQFEGGTSLAPAPGWPDAGKNQLIFQSDTACELGGGRLSAVSALALTDSAEQVPADEILLIGSDLSRLRGEVPYARLALLRVNEEAMGDGKAFYQDQIREYTTLDLTPQQIQAILDRWRTEGIGSVPAMATSQGAQIDYSKTTQFRQHPASTLQRGSRDNQEVRV